MKGFFKKINTYSFWVSLSSAMLILVQAVGRPLGLEIDEEVYMSVINSVLGVFVLVGIVPKADPNSNFCEEKTEDVSCASSVKDCDENNKDIIELSEEDRQLLISLNNK